MVQGRAGNSGNVIDIDDEQASGNGIFAWLAAKSKMSFDHLAQSWSIIAWAT
jgi:hypothetical protein